MSEIVVLKAALTRKLGAIEIQFGIERSVEVTDAKGILQAYDILCGILEAQVSEYEMHRFKDLPAPMQQAAAASGSRAIENVWYPATKLILSVNAGRKLWRIMPGGDSPWKKYGATIFWDTFQGFTEKEAKEMLQPGEFEAALPAGTRVLVAVQGGKPKALKIDHKDNAEV